MPVSSSAPVTLQVEGVSKRYEETHALRGVDIAVSEGEWLGLLGPNGAGKTTLLTAIAGLIAVDAGRFTFLGENIEPAQHRKLRDLLGLVPQGIALYPDLTAEENLAVFARFHGLQPGEAEERLAWALTWTGLEDRRSQRVSTFSGGMKRRLNIACGVLHRPKIVLLDEPTVGVDPQARQRIWTMLDELRQAGASLIHSSHQLDEVESTCDRIVILDHGRKIGDGRMEDLLQGSGESPHSITMRFSAPPPVDAFGPAFQVRGSSVSGTLSTPARDLDRILKTQQSLGIELVELRITAPRLEDLFKKLTGAELRE